MDLCGHEREIPIPIPMSSSTYVGVLHGHNTPITTTTAGGGGGGGDEESKQIVVVGNNNKVVKYRECLKNHAAPMGGNATDGCGEFMPSGEEGTLEAFKCSACSCHRNFHRKEVEGEEHCQPLDTTTTTTWYTLKGRTPAAATYGGAYMARPPPAMIMPLGAAAAAMHTSESDDMEEGYGGAGTTTTPMVKKRFRTKFTQEQKEKMLVFADKVGWRLQRQEESLVQHFCQEIGVKRRVLKVWMHNNKHNLAKKNPAPPPPPPLHLHQ